MTAVRSCLSSCSSWLYPSRCALCSVLGPEVICDSCLQDFVPSDIISTAIEGPPLSLTASLYPYSGRTGQAVRRLKYSRATALGSTMAGMLADGIDRLGLGGYDLVVPVPIHWSRRCMRGFNQSEILAAGIEGVRTDVLRRIRRTKPQTRLSREARMHNLRGAFRASPMVQGKTVLLVDDVLTSGQTVWECARALADAGAAEVAAIAFAG